MELDQNDMELLELVGQVEQLPLPRLVKRGGQSAKVLMATNVDAMSAEEFRELFEDSSERRAELQTAAPNSALKQIRARHHRVAQMVALGELDVTIHRKCGISTTRIGALKQDPAFQGLVEHYRQGISLEDAAIREKLLDISDTAIELLADRLDDDPDQFTNSQLVEVVKMAADRSGNGTQQTVNHAHLHLHQNDISRIKEVASQNGNTNSVTLIRQTRTLAITAAPESQGLGLGSGLQPAGTVSKIGAQTQGSQEEGDYV